LFDAIRRFEKMERIATHEFKQSDVVRNPLITKILQRYENPNEDRN
jgi:phosphate starvation-inducible protein PhoH